MRFLVLTLASALTAVSLATASPADAETRALSGFASIHASEGISLDVTQGPDFAVTVEGRETNKIETSVRNGALNISRRGWFSFGRQEDAHVRVTLPRLAALTAASGVQANVHAFEAQNLNIDVSQGAVLEAPHIRVGALTLAASQGAQITIGGACSSVTARASMGAVVDAGKLECASATANASMGATMEIHASDTVNASASMGGMIDVSGRPAHREASSGMGGQIEFN
jgi:hypothetical protein